MSNYLLASRYLTITIQTWPRRFTSKNRSVNLSAKSLCALTFAGPLSVSFVNVQVTGRLREKQQCHKLQEGRNATKSQEIWPHFLRPHHLPKQSIGWEKQTGDSCIVLKMQLRLLNELPRKCLSVRQGFTDLSDCLWDNLVHLDSKQDGKVMRGMFPVVNIYVLKRWQFALTWCQLFDPRLFPVQQK